jgi:hypothetical protein
MMGNTSPHLQALEEIEKEGISGFVEVLREEGLDPMRLSILPPTSASSPHPPLPAIQRAFLHEGSLLRTGVTTLILHKPLRFDLIILNLYYIYSNLLVPCPPDTL